MGEASHQQKAIHRSYRVTEFRQGMIVGSNFLKTIDSPDESDRTGSPSKKNSIGDPDEQYTCDNPYN